MQNKNIILIDLDAILDTRVGTLSLIDEDETLSILEKGYLDRTSDDLSVFTDKITNEQFKEAYESRTVDTLTYSRLTNIIWILCHETYRMHYLSIHGHTPVEDYAVVVNVHPYNLTEEEEAGISYMLQQLLGPGVPVRIIRLAPESTELSYLALREFTDYITYDIRGWIERQFGHCEKFEDYVIEPNIRVWGPKLLLTSDALDDVYNKFPDLKEEDNPFDLLRVMYGPYVGITWLDPKDFSVVLPTPDTA